MKRSPFVIPAILFCVIGLLGAATNLGEDRALLWIIISLQGTILWTLFS